MNDHSLIKPKITTLIPTFQRSALLKRAINSVLRQTYKNLQVVVFDNASCDDTSKTVNDLAITDNRIKYICHSHNVGFLSNFKYAFQSIDTEYFSILSDDDFLVRNFYENAIQILDKHVDIGFVILDTLCVDDKLNLKSINISNGDLKFFNDPNRFDHFHSGNIPLNWTSMVFRKEIAELYLEMNNKFDIGNDMRFLFRAASRYNFAYLAQVGGFFMLHDKEITQNRPIFSHVESVIQMERYAEIICDENVPTHIKDRAKYFLRKMNNKNMEWTFFKLTIKALLRNYIEFSKLHEKIINSYTNYLIETGNLNLSRIFIILKNNLFMKIILSPLFYILKIMMVKRRKNNLLNLKLLQEGVYKELFDDIRQIDII